MYVRLNLATKPLVSHRRFFAGAALLGTVAGVLFFFLFWRFYTLRRDAADLRARTREYQVQLAILGAQREELNRFFAQQENAKLQDRASFIKAAIEARGFNWTQMFMDLEKTLPPGVHIVGIQPTLAKGSASVKFIVGAANEDAKVKLLKSFENSKSFSRVELLSERVATQPGGDPVTVEFTAVYSAI